LKIFAPERSDQALKPNLAPIIRFNCQLLDRRCRQTKRSLKRGDVEWEMEPIAAPLTTVASAHGKRVGRAIPKFLPTLVANPLSLFIFVLIWEFFSNYLNNPLFPGPLVVGRTFWVLLTAGDLQGITLFQHSYVSLFRVLLGFAAACLSAIPLGIVLGSRFTLERGR
jgi:hypothetical protein